MANDAAIDSNAIIAYIAIIAIKQDFAMSSLTVRNIPEDAKLRFRQVAAAHGRSMEEHLRQLVIMAAFGPETGFEGVRFEGVRDVSQTFRHDPPETAGPETAGPETAGRAASRARIERLIALGRGLDFDPPPREAAELREIDFG